MKRLRLVALTVALMTGAAGPTPAQGFSLEALGSAEAWKTDDGSLLLARNGGQAVVYGQVYAWLAYQPSPRWRFIALGELYTHSGPDSGLETELQMLSVRWWRSRAVRIEAGRILSPVGEFAARRFANVNPLIGAPDTYGDAYPWGATVSGGIGAFDYTAAAVTLPAVNERYTPAPGARLRPVIGAGLTLSPGLRIGLTATHGSYLGSVDAAQLSSGMTWSHFQQTVAVLDLRYSAGRFDNRAEATWSSYQVPTVTGAVHGFGWYAESRATISPRLFAAIRLEHNRYAFVQPVDPSFWVGAETTQMNGELGLGYRFSSDALLKASVRTDHWPVHEKAGTLFPDGYALAVQFSLQADLLALVRGKP